MPTRKPIIPQIRAAEARVAELNRELKKRTGLTENEGLLLILLHRMGEGWTNHVELDGLQIGWGFTRSGAAVRGLKRKGLVDYERSPIRFRINTMGRAALKLFKVELE